MTHIVRLIPQEKIRHDPEAMAAIYRNLGATLADRVISRALAELALTLSAAVQMVDDHELREFPRQMQRLRGLADNLGMQSLSRAAMSCKQCLEDGDGAAFSAVWQRLMRITERSLDTQAATGETRPPA